MPVLGGSPANDGFASHGRQISAAYPGGPRSRTTLYAGVLAVLTLFWILPNLFLRDYKEEALTSLRSSGKTEEQIERWFPKSVVEKRKVQRETFGSLQQEVADLRVRLEALENATGLVAVVAAPDEGTPADATVAANTP